MTSKDFGLNPAVLGQSSWTPTSSPPSTPSPTLLLSDGAIVNATSSPYDRFLATTLTSEAGWGRDLLNITSTESSSVFWCRNESAMPHEETFVEFYQTARFVTGLILYPCICIPGLLGNVLTLIVLWERNMRTSTNAFLSALAVSDSIKLINDLLYFLSILLLRTDDTIGNRAYGYLYPYAHFIFSMSVCVSSWLTVSVAVERYIMVCHPTRARHLCSRQRAVTVCVAVYIIMTTLALPSALRYGGRNMSISAEEIFLTGKIIDDGLT